MSDSTDRIERLEHLNNQLYKDNERLRDSVTQMGLALASAGEQEEILKSDVENAQFERRLAQRKLNAEIETRAQADAQVRKLEIERDKLLAKKPTRKR